MSKERPLSVSEQDEIECRSAGLQSRKSHKETEEMKWNSYERNIRKNVKVLNKKYLSSLLVHPEFYFEGSITEIVIHGAEKRLAVA